VTEEATRDDKQTAETMIRLENLSKVFPAQDEPAVEDLSMDIYDGEIARPRR
jgi:osmoprotectant transport system ATP-binding protein